MFYFGYQCDTDWQNKIITAALIMALLHCFWCWYGARKMVFYARVRPGSSSYLKNPYSWNFLFCWHDSYYHADTKNPKSLEWTRAFRIKVSSMRPVLGSAGLVTNNTKQIHLITWIEFVWSQYLLARNCPGLARSNREFDKICHFRRSMVVTF